MPKFSPCRISIPETPPDDAGMGWTAIPFFAAISKGHMGKPPKPASWTTRSALVAMAAAVSIPRRSFSPVLLALRQHLDEG